jgi:putative Mn2+ efflux pump MntP
LAVTTILIAFGLAMDSFSVSITNGLTRKFVKVTDALKIGLFFGFFQAIMPVFGWLAGENVIEFIAGFDHWIAFGLLSLIGCRMMYESIKKDAKKVIGSLSLGILLMLSIATSIDALAVGLSLSFSKVSIVAPAIATGLITFSLSFLGMYLGSRFGRFLKNKIEVLGGMILIIIGLNILIEHL